MQQKQFNTPADNKKLAGSTNYLRRRRRRRRRALYMYMYMWHMYMYFLHVFRFLSLTGHLKCKDYCWVPFTGDALLFRFQQVMEDFSRNNTTSLTTLVSRLK